MSSLYGFFEFVLTAIAVIVILWIFSIGVTYEIDGLIPGDQVVVMLNQTAITNGQPCRQYVPAFVSPIGPGGGRLWHRPERVFFPFEPAVSIIYSNGTKAWVEQSLVVKINKIIPELVLCPTPTVLE